MILVDYRSGSADLMDFIDPALCTKTDLSFDVDGSGKLVPCGDAMLTGNGPENSALTVGVELKSISDALQSISVGRLGGTQIPRMLKVYDVIFLLIFGVCRPGPDNYLQVRDVRHGKVRWKKYNIGRRPVPWSYFEGFLLTAQLQATICKKPLFVKQVENMHEAAIWLTILDSWLDKPWDKHRGLAVFDKSRQIVAPPDTDPIETQIATTAASLPGLDWTRGWAAAKHFNSVEEMIGASVADWKEIKGIGPVLAKTAHEIIRRTKNGSRSR